MADQGKSTAFKSEERTDGSLTEACRKSLHRLFPRGCVTVAGLAMLALACDRSYMPTSPVRPFLPGAPARSVNVSSDRDRIGVNVNTIDNVAYKLSALDAAQSASVHWIRSEVTWPAVEPSNGSWDFSAADFNFTQLHNRGFRVLALLKHVPCWANGQSCDPSNTDGVLYPPSDYALWEAFVDTVVTRYSTEVEAWEIWNEPNCNSSYKGDVASYDSLANRAARVIKRHGKTAVLGGIATGLHACDINDNETNQKNWVQGRLAQAYADSIDVVGLHRYGNPTSDVVTQVRHVLDDTWTYSSRRGISLPFWLTEAGDSRHFSNSTDDQEQNAIAVNEIIGAMVADTLPNASLWQATFFWHLYDTNEGYRGVVVPDGSTVDTTRAYHLLRRLTEGCVINGTYYRCEAVHEKYNDTTADHLYTPTSVDPVLDASYYVAKYASFYTSPVQIDAQFHPLFRCKAATYRSTYVTQDWNCDSRSGYSPDRIIGWVSDDARSSSTLFPLWRLYNVNSADYFLTTDTAKKNTLLGNSHGWQLDSPGPLGYVWRRGGSGGEDEP